ncbi:hypothetical protein K461DRAFT_282432 [Myriangium duriaei CBS 260.36]|uniref:Rhodopsin domain-containing protein n=1 Tax=Myriangium duriaei CBS 260.36 TaxID=1168546 RepID=A0A9P4IY40_9PEZI|nr:hypothetical protein K461DRAFT_282432 [Myriangium duriaei CBS 260.36]
MASTTAPSAYGGQGDLIMGLSWTQAVVSIILVLLRAYAARTHSGRLRWDFIYVAAGTVFGLACQIILTQACVHGVGNHIANVLAAGTSNLWEALHLTWTAIMVGLVGITFGKLSIVALLLHVTLKSQPWRRTMLWTCGALTIAINAAQIIFIVTQCSPLSHLWHPTSPGTCRGQKVSNSFAYFQGAVAVAADVFLACYPVTVIWSLNMSFKTKVGFCLLMAGGFLPAAAGIIRCIFLDHLTKTVDVTYEFSPFLLWAITEMWFVIILGSIPPLRPLFERVFLGKVKTISGASKPAGSGNQDYLKMNDSWAMINVQHTNEVMVTIAD